MSGTSVLYRAIAAAAILGCATSALAVPVRYEFTTGTSANLRVLPDGTVVPAADPAALGGLLSGLAVTGSFYYDSEAAVTAVTPGGHTLHDVAFNQLSGSIGTLTFSDGVGLAQVANDLFQSAAGPLVDILQLSASSVSANDFVGGSVNGIQLINARIFWIEGTGVPSVVPDFLSATALPNALPTFAGRLSLDFGTPGQFPTTFLFRDDLIVRAAPAAVSEPESVALVLLGLVGLVAARRRARNLSD